MWNKFLKNVRNSNLWRLLGRAGVNFMNNFFFVIEVVAK